MSNRAGLATLLLAVLACGCDGEKAERVRVPKEAPAAALNAPAPGSAAFPTARAEGLRWTAPAGWKELAASGMRAGTLVPPSAGGAEVSIFAFPGDAGGEPANVNRWRGQIGLPPLSDEALARERRELRSPAGEVSLYGFTGQGAPPSRVVAGLLKAGEVSWFFKLAGPEAAVAEATPAFTRMLEGLRSR